jgi:hypothetical protein
VAAAAVVWLWLWVQGAERRALLGMPADDRRALFEEARRNTEALCSQAKTKPALRGRCVDAAEFLREFPECDAPCQSFAHGFTEPTR